MTIMTKDAIQYPPHSMSENAKEVFGEVASRYAMTYAERYARPLLERIAALEARDRGFRDFYAYMMNKAPWSESNDMDQADEMFVGFDQVLERAEQAEARERRAVELLKIAKGPVRAWAIQEQESLSQNAEKPYTEDLAKIDEFLKERGQ